MFIRASTEGTGPLGPAGGDLAGSYPNPSVIGMTEPSGPTDLIIGAVPNQTFLQRVGVTVVGTDPNTVVKGPWATVLYVDNVRGSDVTAVRGNANLPFATVQAAMNAMVTDDTIWCAPQRFAPGVQQIFPASVVRGTLRGTTTNAANSSVGSTQPATIFLNPGTFNGFGFSVGASRFNIQGVQFQNVLGGVFFAINADGVAQDLTTLSLNVNDCVGVTVKAQRIVGALFSGCRQGGLAVFVGCLVVTLQRTQFFGVTLSFTAGTDPAAFTTGCSMRLLEGSSAFAVGAAITMTGQVQLAVDETSTIIGGLLGNGLLAPSGAATVRIVCCGFIDGAVDFASAGAELPDTATALTIDFRGTRFYSAGRLATSGIVGSSVVKFKVGGAAGNFQTVKLDSTTTLPGCAITADAKIHLTGLRAQWPAVVLATPGADGDIIPPTLTGTIDTNGLAATPKTWVQLGYAGLVRTGAAPDTAFLTSVAQACDAVIPTRSTTGLSFTGNAVANLACWEAVWK